MIRLIIKDKIGSRCIIKEDGQKIFDEIYEPLKNGKLVILDFNGVDQFAAPFFNFAIGQLFKDISVKQLCRFLQLEKLNEIGGLVVKQVIKDASKYYWDESYRKIVGSILEQQAKEACE